MTCSLFHSDHFFDLINYVFQTSFGSISLKGVAPGNWMELTEKEMLYIQKVIKETSMSPSTINSSASTSKRREDNDQKDDEQ